MKYTCHCCRLLTLVNFPIGTYEICPVCFWEDDPNQANNQEMVNGANIVSLNAARENFKAFGACSREFITVVRQPRRDEIPE